MPNMIQLLDYGKGFIRKLLLDRRQPKLMPIYNLISPDKAGIWLSLVMQKRKLGDGQDGQAKVAQVDTDNGAVYGQSLGRPVTGRGYHAEANR